MNTNTMQSKVDALFAHLSKPSFPGCAVSVVQDGKTLFKQGYGLANIENEVPITPKSVFNIGSMSKQFTALAIALLADEGKLSLDDDIWKYLPDMPKLEQTVSIRHLVYHTSGIRNSFPALLSLAEWRDIDATSTVDVFKLLKMQRGLNFTPGEQYEYSNSNYILMALIVAKISGFKFGKFMKERIFTPLEMNDTFVNEYFFQLIPHRVDCYFEHKGYWNHEPLTDTVIGSTNIYTNVLDLAKWQDNFRTHLVGNDRVFAQMVECGVLNDGTQLDYAFGLETGPDHQHRGWQIVEHGGSHGGYASHMMRFPQLELSVIVLFNHFLWNSREYAIRLADVFLEDHPQYQHETEETENKEVPRAFTLTPSQLKEKVGTYFSDEQIAKREISVKDEQLYFNQYLLLPITENLFYFEVEPATKVEFISADKAQPASMKTITGGGEYLYRMIDHEPAEANLMSYTGKYYSPELDVYWKIKLVDGVLQVVRRKYVESQLTLLLTDIFTDDWEPLLGYPTTYSLDFRPGNGDFIVSGSGVRGIVFEKCNP